MASRSPEVDKGETAKHVSLKLWVDEPKGRLLTDCECRFSAWGISSRPGLLDRLAFRTSSGTLKFRNVDRPDVQQSYPQMQVRGFVGTVSVLEHLPAVEDGNLPVRVMLGPRVVARFQLRVAPGVLGRTIQQATAC